MCRNVEIIKIICAVLGLFFSITTRSGMLVASETMEAMTIDGFIMTAGNDLKLQNQKELTRYLKGAPSSTPYIDRMEFRTKTDEFDLEKQTYSLRIYPKGWGETQSSKRVTELVNQSCRTEESNCYNTALKERYELVIDYMETMALIALKKELITVSQDRIHVLEKKSAESISFDISDLIAAEELLTQLRLDCVKLDNKVTGLVHQIAVAANSKAPIGFDTASLVQVPEIEQMISELTKKTPLNNIKLQDQKIRMELADSKYKLEQAKQRDYLNFFQLSYDSEDHDDNTKAYAIEFAIKLPFIHSDRDEVNRKKATYMKELLKYKENMSDLAEKQLSLTRSLDRMIKQYALLQANKKNSNAEVSFKAYLKMDGIDPLDLLKIKESIIKSDVQLAETGFNIRYGFIELMDIMGKLHEKPFKNYLIL